MADTSLRARAVALLARREHSRVELERKLGASAAEGLGKVLDDLEQLGLQSDERFASEFVRARAARGHGPRKIRAELSERGIAAHLAERALEEAGQDWLSLARAAHDKRFGDAPVVDRRDWSRRARFLAARGFPSDLIARVVDEAARRDGLE